MDMEAIQKRISAIDKLKTKINKDIDDEEEQINLERQLLKQLIDGTYLNKIEETKLTTTAKNIVVQKNNNCEEFNFKEKRGPEYFEYLHKYSDKNYFNRIKAMLDNIPESNGSRFYEKIKLNIGIVADEFLYNSFQGIANFIYISPENYKTQIKNIDIIFIATTWKGLNLEWKGLGSIEKTALREVLFQIIDLCKADDKKVIFYSKEDPVNYDFFIDIAKKCDYIFTTAAEKLEDYKRDCNNDKVEVLSFGINPHYHNPIGMRKNSKENSVIFAGSWYDKYPERQKETIMLFDGVLESDKEIKIIDRNFNLKLEKYCFPKKYIKFISPAIEHSYLQKVHKLYNWAFNFNSVKYSPTMFANRVFELQALGNIMISNYSMAINNKFPNVFLVSNKEEIKRILGSFSEEDIYKHQTYGIRRVMSRETTYDRLLELLKTIGITYELRPRKVAVIAEEINDYVEAMFNQQSYKYKELILKSNFHEENKKEYDIIAFFHQEKFYDVFYLEDMINGFKYTNCNYITKEAYYEHNKLIVGVEHDYVNEVKDKYRTVFWSEAYTAEELLTLKCPTYMVNGYSIDHLEFNNNHTNINTVQNNEKKFDLAVIVPTFNNGDYLLNKCFNSLKRSSIFNKMEIVIVDDGSTDDYTIKIIKKLAREHNNVKTYFYNDGGSGSASRPRNKGLELVTSEYVTYLDPDNEAINDGYSILYEEIKNGDFDFVVGNMLRMADRVNDANYYTYMVNLNKSNIIDSNFKELLIKSNFKAISIQALVAKRAFLERYSFKMVEGAIGQDTLFFHEMFLNASRVKFIDVSIHIYYAAVEGSVTNSITKKFFERYLIMEKARLEKLEKYNILKDYLNIRFEIYFMKWYLEKLKRVREEDAIEAIKLLKEIYKLYSAKTTIISSKLLEIDELFKKNDYEAIKQKYVNAYRN